MLSIYRGLLLHGDADLYYENEFSLSIRDRNEKGIRRSRYDGLSKYDIKKIAKKLGFESRMPNSGEEDFKKVREILEELRVSKGARTAFKPPGYQVHDSEVILPDSIKKLLRKEDLFVFLMMPIQAKLLKEFGQMVATDGTHSIFG